LQILKKNQKQWKGCFPGRKRFLKYVTNGAACKAALTFAGALIIYHLLLNQYTKKNPSKKRKVLNI
ncbi:MAG: hypothetical protein IJH71_09380, partial [Eubacterium sp.]|nr:hypothetical protein [Eubacterium sp.]